jgi:hypothetical protein
MCYPKRFFLNESPLILVNPVKIPAKRLLSIRFTVSGIARILSLGLGFIQDGMG